MTQEELVDAAPLSASSRAVAVEILVHGPRSRTQLAQRLGLSAATLTRLVKPLVEAGVLAESDAVRTPGRGRSSLPLDVVPDRHRFIGIKLTTEAIYAVVTDLRARILDQEVVPLRSLRVPDVVAAVVSLVAGFQARTDRPVDGVGVTVGGQVDAGEIVADSPFLHWHDVPFRSLLSDELGVPVHLDNDVVGLTKAQHWFGHGKGYANFALLTVGAGIGYGLVVNNALVPTLVSPVSHFPVDPSGPLCPLGHRGCMSAYLTSGSITSAVSIGHGRPIDYDHVLEMAAADDPVAGRVVREAARALGRTAAAISTLTGVERIILSGEGVHLAEVAQSCVDQGFAEYGAPKGLHSEPVVRPMSFLEWARGAAVIAIQTGFPSLPVGQTLDTNDSMLKIYRPAGDDLSLLRPPPASSTAELMRSEQHDGTRDPTMHRSTVKTSAAFAALVLATAGCTGGAPNTSSDDDGGAIRYLVEQPEDPAVLDLLEEHIKDFEEESGITVELEAMPTENMRTVLQTQLRSGEGPDVFNWGSGPGYAGALAEAGLLYDLTEAYAENDWPIYDFAKERVTFDGKVVGVPGEMETIGLFYNKTLLAELGIAEPANLAELRSAADTLRDEGIVPIAVSDQEGWQGGHLLSMSLSSELGSDGMDALLNGEAAWDSPDVVEALQTWKDFNEAGYLPESPTSLSYDGANALFYSGDAAMVPTGSWLVSGIEENTEFEVGYIPFPATDGPGAFTAGLGSGPFISAGSAHTDAALEFVDFLVSPEHGRWTVENIGTIPPYPVDTEGADVSPLFAQVLEDTSGLASGTSDMGHNIDVLTTDVFNQAMWDGVQAVLTGQKSAEEVAQDLQASFQQ